MNPPTVVRLNGFPESARVSDVFNSSVVVLSERDADVEVTMRITNSSLTFDDGSTEFVQTDTFTAGEQREVVFDDWSFEGQTIAPYVMIEIGVRYADHHHVNTATALISLEQREARIGIALAIGGALVAAALGLAALSRRYEVEVVETEVEVTDDDSLDVLTEEDVPDEIVVAEMDVQPRRPAKKRTAAKQSTAKKTSAKSSASKKSASTKSSSKKASSSQASGTRRGSSASGSAPRKDGRGSSAGRKSGLHPPRPTFR
jgi:Mg-chelatase subunit ChlI